VNVHHALLIYNHVLPSLVVGLSQTSDHG